MGRWIVRVIVDIIISGMAIGLTSLLPGIHVIPFDLTTLLLLGLIIGVIDAIVRPVAQVLSLPFTVLTLGLFQFVLNALLLYLVALIVPSHLHIDTFWWAVAGGVVLGIAHSILEAFFGRVGKPASKSDYSSQR